MPPGWTCLWLLLAGTVVEIKRVLMMSEK
jgi:hypothetical protein